jgi:uncharacterized protein YciI
MGKADQNSIEAEMASLVPTDMTTVYLVFLIKGPSWTPEESEELDRLQLKHLAHLKKLKEGGQIIINGPCPDGEHLRGVSVYRVDSLEEAKALAEADPAVQAGRLAVEIHPWWVSASTLPSKKDKIS